MGQLDNLTIKLGTYTSGIRMHLDGESMNLFGDVDISIQLFHQVNVRFAELTYY